MRKLLIATASVAIADRLRELLPQFHIRICRTGPETLAALDDWKPDALVIALSLPVVDGLSVLRQCTCKPERIIALTDIATAEALQSAYDAGIRHILRLPCSVALVAALLTQWAQKIPSPEH